MAEKSNNKAQRVSDLSYQSIAKVLDSLDAFVYVSDMDTYELIFTNEYGRNIWGDIQGKTCWKVLQEGQNGPCEFCTNDRLLDKKGEPTEVYVWEFQNTVNERWYQCRDQAITWVDGRIVRMEIATDITERKLAEDELKDAKRLAEELAFKDELTSLCNRRAFFEQGNRIFKQAIRYRHPVSVIMMDIDHFKNINDTYGHSVGDIMLQAIAKLLLNTVREIDIVARMGGEEFAFVLPETDTDEAINTAERLRQKIEDLTVEHNDELLKITASFGISSCSAEKDSLESLLTKADDALYIAKKRGRNRVNA
ncbi:MAG: GGDEF domain-containing protein [Gammaproteobacteria bacterium]|nr:GGDEF domain-containing protein [Gammaproteobacteria bacterium]